MARSKEVDAWFAKYDNPMKPVVQRVRDIILSADARVDECIKWQAPTFTYKGNLASFFPKSKQHASLMFHRGAEIPGQHPILVGDADKGRSLKLATVAEAEKAKTAIVKVVKAWCDWRDGADAATPKTAKSKTAKPAGAAGYDEATADRVRAVLAKGDHDVVERKMFGGLCFMVDGKMACGLTKDSFMVRVGKEGYERAMAEPHVRPMTFTGRPLSGFVYVDAKGIKTLAALARWVTRGVSAPAPTSKKRARRRPLPRGKAKSAARR